MQVKIDEIDVFSLLLRRIHLMVGCTKSTKNINKYSKCYGSSFCSSQTHDRYYSCSCSLNESPFLSFHIGPRHLFSGDSGGSGGNGGDGGVDGSSDEAGGEGSSGVGSDHRGVVDDMVGGVGGGLGVNVDAGHVVDGVADLVSNETGLGDQVGLDGLVDGGSGDSDGDGGVDGVHVDGRDGVDGSDGGSVDSSDGSSSDSRGSSVGKTVPGKADTGKTSVSGNEAVSGKAETSVASADESVSSDQLGSGGSHGGAEDGRKDNLEEKRVDEHSVAGFKQEWRNSRLCFR